MSAASLRIAIISRRVHPAHGPGGMEKHVFDQARHLARAGVEVDVFSETPDETRRQAAESALAQGVTLHWTPPGHLPLGGRRGTVVLDRLTNYPDWARRVARALPAGYDVVHAHGLGGLGVAADRARRRLATPLVVTTHGMEEFYARQRLKYVAYAPFRRWVRRIASAADRVVITDEAMVPMAMASLRLERQRLVVVPNAIDPHECTAGADSEAAERALGNQSTAAPLLLSVGRLEANKGFATLASALGRARDRLPPGWLWVLVGEGPDRATIQAAIRRAGIGDRVRLLGRVSDPVKYGLMARASWFVHPTLFEGSSLVTLEAMAHACPVLGTRAGGLPDKIQEGHTGFLVPPGDVPALEQGLLNALAADGVSMGQAGRRLLDAQFTWDAVATRLLNLYRELRERAGRVR